MNKLFLFGYFLLFSFFSYQNRRLISIKPNYSTANYIDFYPTTDSLKPGSYSIIDSIIEVYNLIDYKEFYLKITPIKSPLENNDIRLLKKRIAKLKRVIYVKSKIKVNNIKLNKEYSNLEMRGITGFIFLIEPKKAGKPYTLKK